MTLAAFSFPFHISGLRTSREPAGFRQWSRVHVQLPDAVPRFSLNFRVFGQTCATANYARLADEYLANALDKIGSSIRQFIYIAHEVTLKSKRRIIGSSLSRQIAFQSVTTSN